MNLTPEQREALADARRVLAQLKDSAAPDRVQLNLARVALENLVTALDGGAS